VALIVRIDVDRPYGRQPLLRHALSRLSSDLYCPKVPLLGYLRELRTVLSMLDALRSRAYVFFRRCTLPSAGILSCIRDGGHKIGLHLENSRSYENFMKERAFLERHVRCAVRAFSKHGSGGAKYGLHHYAPYEPDKYVEWARRSGMNLFLGNLQDPSLPCVVAQRFHAYPSAFWLEPAWRDTHRFTVDWLLQRARDMDTVLLIHPENVLARASLVDDFKLLISSLPTRIF
jgi:hypothetical protein